MQLRPCQGTGADYSNAAPPFFFEGLAFIRSWASHEKGLALEGQYWSLRWPEWRWHEILAVFNHAFACSMLTSYLWDPGCLVGSAALAEWAPLALPLAFPKLLVLMGSFFAKDVPALGAVLGICLQASARTEAKTFREKMEMCCTITRWNLTVLTCTAIRKKKAKDAIRNIGSSSLALFLKNMRDANVPAH